MINKAMMILAVACIVPILSVAPSQSATAAVAVEKAFHGGAKFKGAKFKKRAFHRKGFKKGFRSGKKFAKGRAFKGGKGFKKGFKAGKAFKGGKAFVGGKGHFKRRGFRRGGRRFIGHKGFIGRKGFGRGFGFRRGFHRRNNFFIGFGPGFHGGFFPGYYGGFFPVYHGGFFGGFGGFHGGFGYSYNPFFYSNILWHNRIQFYHNDFGYGAYHPPVKRRARASYYASTSNDQIVGTILGGVVGGVIGAEIDGGYNRTAGALIGTVVGAALGNELAKDYDDSDRYYNDRYLDDYRQADYRPDDREDRVRDYRDGRVVSNDDEGDFDQYGRHRAETRNYEPPREIRKCIRYQYRGGDYVCTKWTVEYDLDE